MEGKDERFVVQGLAGKRTLSGRIPVYGAKNAALKAMAATLLFKDKVTLKNLPDIEDVRRMEDLLSDLGVVITRSSARIARFSATNIHTHVLSPAISKRLRASIALSGPLLARTGKVSFPHPGGCVIGARPIDLYIEAFQKMGARVVQKDEMYMISAPKGGLRGAEIFFRKQSVVATETFMMAAVLAKGTTTLKNVAMEPEIEHLARFLNACGARILGAGTPTISIKGNGLLSARGRAYTTPPDRIEAGSFLILGALAAKDLTITDCDPTQMESLLEILSYAGVPIERSARSLRIRQKTSTGKQKKIFRSVEVKTHEYPGFPTDLQAPMTVFLTQTKGESMVFETIFEGRLNYVEELNRMGADILTMDLHRAIVKGPTPLRGRELESPDLRAGLAFVMAAIVANGRSVVHNVYNIDRGYECVEERLRNIGVKIERVK